MRSYDCFLDKEEKKDLRRRAVFFYCRAVVYSVLLAMLAFFIFILFRWYFLKFLVWLGLEHYVAQAVESLAGTFLFYGLFVFVSLIIPCFFHITSSIKKETMIGIINSSLNWEHAKRRIAREIAYCLLQFMPSEFFLSNISKKCKFLNLAEAQCNVTGYESRGILTFLFGDSFVSSLDYEIPSENLLRCTTESVWSCFDFLYFGHSDTDVFFRTRGFGLFFSYLWWFGLKEGRKNYNYNYGNCEHSASYAWKKKSI